MEVVVTEGLKKTYGSGPTAVEALKETNLTLLQGEFVAIVGASGSGKSTLLHLLGGLDKPSSGSITLEGKNITALSETDLSILRRRKFGFIFQYYNLIPILSAEENIVLPLLLDGKTIDKQHVADLIHWLGLEKRKNHLPGALSGGQQQRVAIARALVYKPSIIFADEPTGNLDKNTTKEVLELLRLSNQKYHQTLVMITHDPNIAAVADRVITLEDGDVISDRRMRA